MNYEPPKSSKLQYNRKQKFECTVSEGGRAMEFINIPFSKMFGTDLGDFDRVRLAGKQTFSNIAPMVCWTLSRIFSHPACDVRLEYASVLTKIRKHASTYALEHLLSDIFIGNPETNTPPVLSDSVCNIINDIQDSIYVKELDEKSQLQDNVVDQLQITDYHAIELLKIAVACRFIAPLLCEFIDRSEMPRNSILYEAFVRVHRHLMPADLHLINKINKFIEARVLRTLNLDSNMWRYYRNLGEDQYTVTTKIHFQVINDIIPKLDGGRVVGYLDKSIKQQIKFFFNTKNGIGYRPCLLWDTSRNSDGLDGFDRHNANVNRFSELYQMIDRISVDVVVDKLQEFYGLIPDHKMKYYTEITRTNDLQKQLLFMFYAKQVGDYQSLHALNSEKYFKLLVYFVDYLQQTGKLPSIKKLLIGIPANVDVEITSRIAQRLSSSASYRKMIDTRYPYVRHQLWTGSCISELLGKMSSPFWEVPTYEEYAQLHANGIDFKWQLLDLSPEALCNEIVQLIQFHV